MHSVHRDCSPLGFSVHGISRARIVEWVAISFSRESSWSRIFLIQGSNHQTMFPALQTVSYIAGGKNHHTDKQIGRRTQIISSNLHPLGLKKHTTDTNTQKPERLLLVLQLKDSKSKLSHEAAHMIYRPIWDSVNLRRRPTSRLQACQGYCPSSVFIHK